MIAARIMFALLLVFPGSSGCTSGESQGVAEQEHSDTHDHDEGHGDLPYPPEYPKMPGEPPRVQPSRARKPASEADDAG